MKDTNLENVKEVYKKLKEITNEHYYGTFEIAYLIMERLDNVIDNEDDITEDLIRRIKNMPNFDEGSLIREDIVVELDMLQRELEDLED